MDTYAVQYEIMTRSDLTVPERLLGMCLAHAMDRKTGKVRRTREWVQGVTGMKGGTLRRAIAGLAQKGVISPTRTGRSTIYEFCTRPGNKCGRVDGPLGGHQTVPTGTIGGGKPRPKPRYPKIKRELTSRADDGCATDEHERVNDLEFMEAVRRDSREKREKAGGI